jgi:DNA-binding CsgD family transcriptional regulator
MPPGTAALEPLGWGLFAQWHALVDQRDPRFSLVGHVREMAEPLSRIEASISVSMWNMQRHHTVFSSRSTLELDASLARKRVDTRFVLPRRVAERRSPLISSIEPDLRLAPVAHPLMICDGALMVVGDSTGETVWTTRDPGIVADGRHFYQRVWDGAERAVPVGEEPPYTPRMVQVAFRLLDGATDREIARALGVSERTVSADVREMSRRLGARSRAQAISLISGVAG